MLVQSGRELYTVISRLLGEQHEGGWACPWCRKLGVYEVEDESASDRLFLSTKIAEGRHPIRFVCRQATSKIVDHHPVHSVEELFAEFGEEVDLAPGHSWEEIANQLFSLVGVSSGSKDIDKSSVFWSLLQVLEHHAHPNTYTEWGKLGFSNETVDKLLLGVLPSGRLSIPVPYLMPVDQFGLSLQSDSYVQRSRAAEGSVINKHNPKYYWPGHGSLPVSLWYRQGKEFNPCRIFEGDTSFITSVELWSDGTAVTTLGGAGSWSVDMSEYLLSIGHTTFHIYTDNDKAGKSYSDSIIECFGIAAEKRETDWSTLSFSIVVYPTDTPEGYDPRKALLEYGKEEAKEVLESWITKRGKYRSHQPIEYGRVHAEYDEQYAANEFVREYEEAKNKLYELDELRGVDGRGLIYQEIGDFVENYGLDEEGCGRVLLIRSTPGVGKTRSAIRFAEDYARNYLAKRKKSVERAIRRLEQAEQTDKVVRKLEALRNDIYKKLAVGFIGAYVDGFNDIEQHSSDPTLWFNWHARNATTCQNMELVEKIVNAGYGVMKTACIEGGLCPLREQCLGYVEGELQYLAQMEEVKQHPLVYLRHNHLYMKDILQMCHLIIVDEDPSAVALSSVTLTASDLKQFNAYDMLDGEEASVVNNLMEAFIGTVELWNVEDHSLMGRRLIDRVLMKSGFRTLHETAQYIVDYSLLDKIAEWRPYDLERAPDGRIVNLLALLVRDILRDAEDWNGQIFVKDNTVVFYPMEPFNIDHKKPVVALDATGMAYKYQLCFNRPVPEFFAEVFPSHQKTYVITNTENTMTTLHDGVKASDMDTSLYGVRDSMTVAVKSRPQNLAVLDDVDKVPNPAMREAIRMTVGLTAKHGQLLVVTYKTARQFMETFINKHFPDYVPYISFGHFRALRGLNVFEHMPAVLVVGTFRVPPERLHRDLIAFHKDDPDLLDLSLIRSDRYYHLTPWRYNVLTVGDSRPTVQQYIEELEAGELQQVAGRIRAAVSDYDKYIYLMTSRPAMPWMTYNHADDYDPDEDIHFTTGQSAAWWWYEAQQAVTHIVEFYQRYGRCPSIAELSEVSGMTTWNARKTLQFWKEQKENGSNISR